jgi:20S proteasome alpha/beta subunit
MIRTLPKQLRRPSPRQRPERLPKGRTVTTGMGFRCSDGIVVCADTQITWKGHKDYECKVCHLSGHDWTIASVYAGSPHLMKSFSARFIELMKMREHGKPATVKEMREIVETALYYFDELETDPMALNLLIGFIIPSKEMGLFKTEGKVASAVSSFDYVGCGDSSVLRYLGPIMADKQQWLSINQALRVGTYCVLQAKRYIDDCGGDTDAFVLGWNGSMQTRSGMTYNWKQHFLRLERELSQICRAIGDTSVSDEDLENRLNTFSKHVKEERSLGRH